MSQRTTLDPESLNHDSFLDIVANMVGIMIILVLLVGMRVKDHSVRAAMQEAGGPSGALEEELAREAGLRRDVLGIQTEIGRLRREMAVQGTRRNLLMVTAAAARRTIDEHRQGLDRTQRAEFDLTRDVSQARRQLEQLDRRRARAEEAEQAPTVVQSYPTPISRPVDDNEIHFLLNGGKIVFVPMNTLVDAFLADAKRKMYRLLETPEITETIGPEGGFRLRYTLERYTTTPEESRGGGQGGTFVRLRRWTLLPIGPLQGETAEEALRPGSKFLDVLAKLLPGRHTITLWTYPDSFTAFYPIRRELYQRGFSAAARPLPQGVPISGSPEGSKSAAQ
ncbi:MAG: hypothetical protein JXB10_00195 [Pirellulales bacterium]|nr:hypothetical protein [Pirellulales bacterium]